MLSITDIAKSLKLSEATVSRALSGKGRISHATRTRVQEFAALGGYVPNSIAQSLVMSKSSTLAFLMPYTDEDSDATFFRQCLAGVCKKAGALSYDVIVVNSDKENEVALQRLIAKRKVDGVLINREPDPAVIDVLNQYDTPYILLGHSENPDVNQVDTDKTSAGKELVTQLLSDGIKKFAYIGENHRFTVNKQRLQGFVSACGASPYVFTPDTAASQAAIDNAVAEALSVSECIITNDDLMCLRVMNSLGRLGVAVPSQIKLACMYHSYLLNMSVPKITAISHKSQDVGAAAASLLIGMLDGGAARNGNKICIEYELVPGESTGP